MAKGFKFKHLTEENPKDEIIETEVSEMQQAGKIGTAEIVPTEKPIKRYQKVARHISTKIIMFAVCMFSAMLLIWFTILTIEDVNDHNKDVNITLLEAAFNIPYDETNSFWREISVAAHDATYMESVDSQRDKYLNNGIFDYYIEQKNGEVFCSDRFAEYKTCDEAYKAYTVERDTAKERSPSSFNMVRFDDNKWYRDTVYFRDNKDTDISSSEIIGSDFNRDYDYLYCEINTIGGEQLATETAPGGVVESEAAKTKSGLAVTKAFISMKTETLIERNGEAFMLHVVAENTTPMILICLLVMLITIIYLCMEAGRTPKSSALKLLPFDKIWAELMLAVIALGCMGGAYTFIMLYRETFTIKVWGEGLTCTILTVTGAICVLTLTSFVRRWKSHTFLKNTLICQVIALIGKGLSSLITLLSSFFGGKAFKKGSTTQRLFKTEVLYIAVSMVNAIVIVMLIVGSLDNYYSYTDVGMAICAAILIVVEFIITAAFLKGSSGSFAGIDSDINKAVDEQVKAERLKLNLITNVSHDLKTPLTSIISYIDLLSKEELLEPSKDYVSILGQKSERLKKIVMDLFDLAKSSSGEMPLCIEDISLNTLIIQTLTDMEDSIKSSGNVIKTSLPEMEVIVKADGKKMYRVMQNLIDNALKYSLAGTRIFIELTESRLITIKNTAGYEMEFTASEVLERFTRGDKARTTDGTGLGLSIAESFTKVCGGQFHVTVDGDMFKVEIAF